ncbi:MAG: alpha-glucosidase, partial [Chloroflexota bacterium]|nr:alpha-glucosidase [Chloroflexota bacterium]
MSSELFERIRFRGNPEANPQSIVISENARFTVLAPRLLRLEWAENGAFEDRGSYAFPTRYREPAPHFTSRVEGEELQINTGALQLCYRQGRGRFTAENLNITFELHGERQTWHPGDANPQNLRGTRRTLDQCNG